MSFLVFMGVLLPLGLAGQEEQAWEIYTKDGVEYRSRSQPTTIDRHQWQPLQ